MSKCIYLIPDTNVLIQCRQLSDLAWKDEFPDVESIVLVLIAPVLREVDRQKGGQGRLAKRARLINSLIGKLIDAPRIDISNGSGIPSVTIISGDQFRPDPELLTSLDYSQADDAIVGAVSTFCKAHADERVELLSNDNGVLLTARRVSVPFHRVPTEWLLPAESDEDQKRMKALEGDIQRLKSSEPACTIVSKDTPWKFTVESFDPLGEPKIQALLITLQRKFPEATDFGPRESATRNGTPGLRGLLAHFGKEEFVPATEDEIASYQRELYPQWIANCEAHLREIHRELEKRQPAPRILVNLLNDGSRPAEDVRVSFCMRGSGGLLIKLPADGDEPSNASADGGQGANSRLQAANVSLPRPPAAPTGRWKKVSPFDSMGRMAALSGVRRFELIPSPVQRYLPSLASTRETDAFYWKVGTRPTHPRPSTELTCQQWRHRSTPEAFEFELVWLDDTKSRKGALHVEIHAANLTDPVTKVFPVEVIAEVGDTWGEAEALIDLLNKSGDRFGLTRA